MKPVAALVMSALFVGSLSAPALAEGACQSVVFPAAQASAENSSPVTRRLVRQWLGGAITDTFSYSFTQIGSVPRPCAFSDAAWDRFRSRVSLGAYEDKVKDVQAVGSAVLAEPPVILARGVGEGGAYMWEVEVEIVPWLETATGRTAEAPKTVRMVVTKDRAENGETGLRVVRVL